MTEQQAMRMALEALRFGLHVGFDESSESQIKKCGKAFDQHNNAITALRQALEQQPEQEPVAYIHESGFLVRNTAATLVAGMKLYTHPPQRKPLTFEQVEDCFPEGAIFAEDDGWLRVSAQTLHDIVRNVEAAHGIKGEA